MASPQSGPEEIAAVTRVLASGQLSQGEQVAALEVAFAAFCGAQYAVAVSSGTAALSLALIAAGVQPGDEVIVPDLTFAATATAVLNIGADPVFADVDDRTFCIDPTSAESLVGTRTTAVVPVDLFGHPHAVDEVRALAERHGLAVIQDAAQAHGAAAAGVRVGAGHIVAFSFHASKNMTTLGEGGVVCTDDADLRDRVRELRSHGVLRMPWGLRVGGNHRLTDAAAAHGLAQLGRLEAGNRRRAWLAAAYTRLLTAVATPATADGCTHAWHKYTVRVAPQQRDALLEALAADGVEARVYYRKPLHRRLELAHCRTAGALDVVERLCDEVLSLPLHPQLSEDDVLRVVEIVERVAVPAARV